MVKLTVVYVCWLWRISFAFHKQSDKFNVIYANDFDKCVIHMKNIII